MTPVIDLVKRNARVAVLIAIAVVLVVVTFIFYTGSQSSADQKAKLENQEKVARVNLSIAQGQYDVAKLQAEKAALAGSPIFPDTFPSVKLSASIVGAADSNGVELVSMNPRGATGTETVGGQQYVRNETNVQVAGDYAAIYHFLHYLEVDQADQFPSLRIENASFTPSDGSFTVVILTQS